MIPNLEKLKLGQGIDEYLVCWSVKRLIPEVFDRHLKGDGFYFEGDSESTSKVP